MTTQTADAVVLVPGFLGFSRIGNFYYFADRVVAVLRGALERAVGRRVPVVPCTTLPTGGLAERQESLIASLAALDAKLGGVDRLHLVGHSAGGLDAQLLTCDRPVRGEWQRAHAVREKIACVVALAAPQHGTCLASAAAARFLLQPADNLRALPTLGKLLLDLGRRPSLDPSAVSLVAGAVASPSEAIKFLMQLIEHRELIADLSPESIAVLRARCRPEGRVPLVSFVTATSPAGDERSDAFFKDLRQLTASCSEGSSVQLDAAASLINERIASAIRSAKAALPVCDATTNDGVVNTVRQLLDPSRPDELRGIVIGDHADVMGHYDRRDALVEGRPLNTGLFHSGAGFGDDQFFDLYGAVARAIGACAA